MKGKDQRKQHKKHRADQNKKNKEKKLGQLKSMGRDQEAKVDGDVDVDSYENDGKEWDESDMIGCG